MKIKKNAKYTCFPLVVVVFPLFLPVAKPTSFRTVIVVIVVVVVVGLL